MTREHTIDAILATPPASVGAAVFLGISLSTWVGIATLVYTVVLLIIKLPALMDAVVNLRARFKNRSTDVQSK